jgi:hypothetical protein
MVIPISRPLARPYRICTRDGSYRACQIFSGSRFWFGFFGFGFFPFLLLFEYFNLNSFKSEQFFNLEQISNLRKFKIYIYVNFKFKQISNSSKFQISSKF